MTVDQNLIVRVNDLARERFGSGTALSHMTPLAGDASTRRYARARLVGPAAPPTMVVMILADRSVAMSSEELGVFSEPLHELPYVNVHRFLAALGVAVPELYVDASDAGVLLLEDVGSVALRDAVNGQSADTVQALFEQAIDQLLLIQLHGTARCDDRCFAFRQAFDARLFAWEFEHFIEYGLVKRLADPPPDAELAVLRHHFEAIAQSLHRQPRVLTHRDFHAWNLFVQNGRIRVLDFQDALLAAAPYDLATLLGDRDTPTVIPPPLERRLLDYYADRWASLDGPAWDDDGLWDVYASCALQKALKVVGRFYFLAREKGKPGYLRYVPPTLSQIDRLLAMRPDLLAVHRILARYFSELQPCEE